MSHGSIPPQPPAVPPVPAPPPERSGPEAALGAGGVAVPPSPPHGSPAPQGLGAAFSTLCQTPLAIWRGNVVGALSIASTAHQRSGSTWLWWVVTLACNAVLVALITVTSAVKAVSAVSDFAGGLVNSFTGGYGGGYASSYISISFGSMLGIFVSTALLTFGALALRAVFLKLVFAVRHVPMPFAVAADLTAAAQSVYTFPLAALALVNFLPLGVTTVLLPVAGFVMLALTVVSIGVEYVGINRGARFAKSPLVPYAVLSTTYLVVALICGLIVTALAS